jgi:hypothetical protein
MKVQTITEHQFHVLGNPAVVDRQQRARSAGTHVSNILSEDGGQERAVPAVDIPVQQQRRHVRLKLHTSSLSLSLSLNLHLGPSVGLRLRLGLSLSLSLVHSCSCIQKINIQLKKHLSNFLYFLHFLKELNYFLQFLNDIN